MFGRGGTQFWMLVFPSLAFVPACECVFAGGAAHEVRKDVERVCLIWIFGLLFGELRPHDSFKRLGAVGTHATAYHAAAPTRAMGYVLGGVWF
jgi:hypothetical protein